MKHTFNTLSYPGQGKQVLDANRVREIHHEAAPGEERCPTELAKRNCFQPPTKPVNTGESRCYNSAPLVLFVGSASPSVWTEPVISPTYCKEQTRTITARKENKARVPLPIRKDTRKTMDPASNRLAVPPWLWPTAPPLPKRLAPEPPTQRRHRPGPERHIV
jgi:hypothetical protein